MKRFIATMVVFGLVITLGAESEASTQSNLMPSEAILLDATTCWQSCQQCQEPCDSKHAGSERDRCKESCSVGAASCCSSVGRKAPNYLTCTCN